MNVLGSFSYCIPLTGPKPVLKAAIQKKLKVAEFIGGKPAHPDSLHKGSPFDPLGLRHQTHPYLVPTLFIYDLL
jgi:hypothetical protein